MMKKYKNGIYEGDYGVTYFVHNNKVLLTHFGNTYKASVLFVFGNWKQPLPKKLIEQFDQVYNKVNQW